MVSDEPRVNLPALPLLLWKTPPGLELVLRQEGVPIEPIDEPDPTLLRLGRFILYDRRSIAPARIAASLTDAHRAIDVDRFRQPGDDPFEAIVDNRAGVASWRIGGRTLTERIARRAKGAIRRRVVGQVREAIAARGGIWARLSPFPHPYRSAFNLRIDLDEPCPDDYRRFAEARRPLDDCATHFVSTAAYGGEAAVLDDLRGLDAQSHGHHHHVYRDEATNRRNLERADRVLRGAGIAPAGFAAPGGRWNRGLDRAIAGLGYRYSSDFGVGYDDLPFFPWLGGHFSGVLQVPVHPVCEGLFLDAGLDDGRAIAEHLVRAIRAKVDLGEPAFVYGHPERRLARRPEVLAAIAAEVARYDLIWRTTLTAFADWWLWRGARRWSVRPMGGGRWEVAFEGWDDAYTPTLEVVRGRHVASLPVTRPRLAIGESGLSFEGPTVRADLPSPEPVRRPIGLKAAVRSAIDWETVTPIDDLPSGGLAALVKRRLRRRRDRATSRGSS